MIKGFLENLVFQPKSQARAPRMSGGSAAAQKPGISIS